MNERIELFAGEADNEKKSPLCLNSSLIRFGNQREDTTPKILRKPLPQILDEMDDNIRAAADAARRAEEAAKISKEAADIAQEHAAEAKLAGERAALEAFAKAVEKAKIAGDLAKEAIKTAEQARLDAEKAGKEAAEEASRVAEKALDKTRDLQEQYDKLKGEVLQLTSAINKTFVRANDEFLAQAPYLSNK